MAVIKHDRGAVSAQFYSFSLAVQVSVTLIIDRCFFLSSTCGPKLQKMIRGQHRLRALACLAHARGLLDPEAEALAQTEVHGEVL